MRKITWNRNVFGISIGKKNFRCYYKVNFRREKLSGFQFGGRWMGNLKIGAWFGGWVMTTVSQSNTWMWQRSRFSGGIRRILTVITWVGCWRWTAERNYCSRAKLLGWNIVLQILWRRMAILHSCCLYRTVRKGSYASVIYTFVSISLHF